jgi:hypothetical protein
MHSQSRISMAVLQDGPDNYRVRVRYHYSDSKSGVPSLILRESSLIRDEQAQYRKEDEHLFKLLRQHVLRLGHRHHLAWSICLSR